MRCDIDTNYLIKTLKQNPGDIDVVNSCLSLWENAGYNHAENACPQIKRELAKLANTLSFSQYWRSCSHIPTMVWIASALCIDVDIVYQAMRESVERWRRVHNRQSMAASFRSVVTFDVLVKDFNKLNGDGLWI